MAGFGTQLLDVAIGMIFVYLMLSILASAIVEALETVLRTRAKYLWQGIGEIVNERATLPPLWRRVEEKGTHRDGDREGVAEGDGDGRRDGSLTIAEVYEHPLISALFPGQFKEATGRMKSRRLPSYIPRENFSAVVIDLVSRRHGGDEALSSIESLRRGIAALPRHSPMRLTLEAIARVSGDDIALVQRRIEDWYDTVMDRVSGWYKRHAHVMLLIVGFALAAGANVDSWKLAKDLARDEPKREALLKAASDFADTHTEETLKLTEEDKKTFLSTLSALNATGGEMNSSPLELPRCELAEGQNIHWACASTTGLGWLITAFAVSLGAAFWFDLLNKMMVVRSTVKPKEKSGDEGSEDRRAGTATRSVPPATFLRSARGGQ